MEGPVFREVSRNLLSLNSTKRSLTFPSFRPLLQLNAADLHAIVPRLQVLARSSPEDKKILVQTLQELGEVVGVTGDGT